LADYLPDITTIADIGDTRGQVAFFDRLLTANFGAAIIDLSHRAFKNFFTVVREIRFFEEARHHSIEPLILFIVDADPNSARAYAMLRHQLSEASLLPVRNQMEASVIPHRDELPNSNIAPTSLDIPLLGLSLRALIDQQSFSFSRFWRKPPADLPASLDDELSSWVERVFFQFRGLGLFLGWEDSSTGIPPNRLLRPRASHREHHCDQRVSVNSDRNLSLVNRGSLDVPEEVLKFAPKKVRNTGSFHPARTELRTAIAGLEAAKAQHHHAAEAEQRARQLHSASERMLAALDDVDDPLPEPSLPYNLVARRAVREKSSERVTATKAAHQRLRVDLSHAETAVRQAAQKVIAAAIDLLVAEGFRQANALEVAWNDVWRHYDRLSALADCQLRYAEGSHPIKLPPDIMKLMQTIAASDRRQFPGGRNHLAAHAGELWCRWFEALLTNANAEAMF
jgi:hypothetical protein